MNKRELLINSKTKRKIGRGPPWRRANYFFSKEIDPSIQHLQDRDLDKSLETCIKNYIVVRLVSILEDFFKGSVSLFVDRNNLPVSILFKGEVKIAMGVFNEMQTNKRTHSVTNGRIIANHFNFANIKEINWVFTELLEYNEKFKELNIDFLRAIKKIDWYDPLRIYKGSWSMAKNWNNFEKMFDIRNDIIKIEEHFL